MIWQEVHERVLKIEAMRGDNEVAHVAEDNLWRDVLQAIAIGTGDDPQKLATEALRTRTIEFERWYA